MSGFASPGLLWLAAGCLVLWWLFARVQRRALDWIGANVSKRFRRRLTAYGPISFRLHLALLLLMALALVVGAAGPYDRGETETVTATGRLLFLVDASASMWASDVTWLPPPVEGDAPEGASEEKEIRRMDVARALARSLTRELRGFRFALGSFSGTAVVHLPMTADRGLIDSSLETFEVHSYYRNTGSSLARALDLVPHFVDRRGYRLQVVLLSDGEQPVEEDLGAQLASLAEQGVPVHSVAIGSTQGQGRRIFNFQDVVDKKENPRTLAEFHTRRVDRFLKTVSRETGGGFFVAEEGVLGRLTAEILEAGLEVEPFEHQAARADRSGRFLLLFLAGLIFDALLFGRRPTDAPVRFDLDRLGPRSKSSAAAASLALAFALVAGCALPFGAAERGSPRQLAHRENERGIIQDGLRKYGEARVHFQRSMGYEVEPQIPAYNLARTVLMTGDFSEAHELFQEALLIDPDLPEAHYNDGMTLYLWGAAERDPNDCELERTRELWGQALRRFSSARAAGVGKPIGDQARANRSALADELAEVDRLIADPPPACRGESEESAGGSGGGSEGENGEGGSAGGGGGGGEGEEGEAGGGAGQEGEGQAGGGEGAEGESGQGEGEGEGEGGGEGGEDQEGQGENQEGEADPENEGDENEGGGGGGAGQPPPGSGEDPSEGGGADLTESELEQIRQQIQQLAAQRGEPGKYHRRTLPEQFRKSDWSNPEATIWW